MPIDKVWIYRLLFVCLFVCVFVILYSNVKFCTEVHRRPGQGISHFWGTLLPQKPKIGRIGARRVDVGSACVDNRQFPSLTVLVLFYASLQSVRYWDWWRQLRCSAQAVKDGSFGAHAAGYSDAGSAGGRQSRTTFLPAVLHLRCSWRRAVWTNRWACDLPLCFLLSRIISMQYGISAANLAI